MIEITTVQYVLWINYSELKNISVIEKTKHPIYSSDWR